MVKPVHGQGEKWPSVGLVGAMTKGQGLGRTIPSILRTYWGTASSLDTVEGHLCSARHILPKVITMDRQEEPGSG